MNPMMAAIKKRKSAQETHNDHSPQHTAVHTDIVHDGNGGPDDGSGGDGKKDLHAFVASLKPHEHAELKSIVMQSNPNNSQAIARGAPSSEEQGKIQQAAAEENAKNSLEEQDNDGAEGGVPEHVSDDIGKSMLDSRHIRGMATEKPKNLGDRVKQSIASKLKAKGKI